MLKGIQPWSDALRDWGIQILWLDNWEVWQNLSLPSVRDWVFRVQSIVMVKLHNPPRYCAPMVEEDGFDKHPCMFRMSHHVSAWRGPISSRRRIEPRDPWTWWGKKLWRIAPSRVFGYGGQTIVRWRLLMLRFLVERVWIVWRKRGWVLKFQGQGRHLREVETTFSWRLFIHRAVETWLVISSMV